MNQKSGAAAARPANRAMTLLLAATVGATLLRIALAARIPLGDDEVYYLLWARHLAWGYPDHPPMIAAVIALGARFFGDSPLAIRILPLLMASATPLLLYAAGRDIFDGAAGRRAALLLLGLPAYTLGATFAFPDAPLSLYAALGLWTGWRALREGGWWWVATAATAALALFSKVLAVFLLLGLLGMLIGGPWRRALRDPGFYAGLLLGVVLIAPTVFWYAHNDWILFRMPRPPWIEDVRGVPLRLLYFATVQFVYHGLLAVPLLASLVVALRRARELAWRYLVWMSVPLLAFTVVLAVPGQAKPHWPTPAYTVLAIALGVLWPAWWQRRRVLLAVAAGLNALLIVGVAAVALAPGRIQIEGTTQGWDRAARIIYQEAAAREAFIMVGAYQSASQIAYQLERVRPAIPVTSPIGAFPFWQPPDALAGRNVVFVDDLGADAARVLGPFCRNIQAVRGLDLPGRRLILYSCEDFSGTFAGFSPRGSP